MDMLPHTKSHWMSYIHSVARTIDFTGFYRLSSFTTTSTCLE